MTRMLRLTIILALGYTTIAGQTSSKPLPNWPSTFKLESVKQVELVYLPEEIETRAGVSRAQLDNWYYCKLTIKEPERLPWMKALATSIRTLHPKPSGRSADVRWGVTFYGDSERRIGSVYFDGSATLGDLDGQPVEISGKSLRAVLLAHFPTCVAK